MLFITGYAENAAVGNGHLAPGMQVLTKPFLVAALANAHPRHDRDVRPPRCPAAHGRLTAAAAPAALTRRGAAATVRAAPGRVGPRGEA